MYGHRHSAGAQRWSTKGEVYGEYGVGCRVNTKGKLHFNKRLPSATLIVKFVAAAKKTRLLMLLGGVLISSAMPARQEEYGVLTQWKAAAA